MNAIVDISKVVLETERLILRPWEENDLEDFYEYAKVDGVGQMAGWNPHKSIEESQNILNLFIEGKKTFALQLKENSKVIGSLGLEELSIDLGEPYNNLKGRAIGYVLCKEYWGMGIMPEAVKRVINYCFNEEKYDFLQCDHSETNSQSQRVIEKSGFEFVKENLGTNINGDVHKLQYYVLKNLNLKESVMLTPNLETERLILRQIKSEDVDAIFKCWMQDKDVSRYMSWKASKDINKAKEFVQFELENLRNDKWNRWIVLQKHTNEIIGTCLIYFNDEENNWDISYNLGKEYWGKGYVSEAMQRVMEYAKNELAINECIAVHAIENPKSGQVLQKLGFQYEKDVPYECNGGEIKTVGKYYKLVVSKD